MRPRRVGVNLLYLVPGEVGGSEVYARELLSALHALEPELELVVYCAPEAAAGFEAVAVTVRPARGRSRNKPLRAGLEQTWLPWRAQRDRVDLLHSLGTTAPIRCPVPSVVTVLDLIFHHVPATFPRASRTGLELIVPRAARHADAVIAISEHGRRDIAAELGVPRESIFVTPLAPAGIGDHAPTPEVELRRRFSLGDSELVLCVSAALAHKNLPRLIDAFAPLALDRDVVLVLAGHDGRERQALAAHAAAAGIPDRVRLTGWIERAELEGLYDAARVFAYPSLIEGFGIPILEAMARGLPVACSNAGALAEVAGDAALLFDPHNTATVTDALRSLLDDAPLREQLIEAGWTRARDFSWERCARETLDVYRHVLGATDRNVRADR
jgi:glycosyltransferase involved in cell wall biosynthesis